MNHRHRGFTLIEVLICSAIIGILFSGVATINVSQKENLKRQEFQKDAANIHEAISTYLFFSDYDTETKISVELLLKTGYLTGENKSPWGTKYRLELKEGVFTVETETESGKRVRI